MLNQFDKQWKREQLGFGSSTLGGYGCLITSFAEVLRHFGWKTNPSMLNRLLKKNKGFSDDLYLWGSVGRIYDYVEKVVDVRNRVMTPQELEEMNEYIKTTPCVIQVDMKPNTKKPDMHFVVLRAGLNIGDPWGGVETHLRKYFGKGWDVRRAVYRIIYLHPKGGGVIRKRPIEKDYKKKYKELKKKIKQIKKILCLDITQK